MARRPGRQHYLRVAALCCAGTPAIALAADEPASATASVAVTVLLVLVAVLLHYEALALLTRSFSMSSHPQRVRIAGLVLSIVAIHALEIGLFGFGYVLLAGETVGSGLAGGPVTGWADYFYFSATVYTTLGFGDLTPLAGLRLLTAAESITGLVLITWSASLTFLEMQRHWREQ